MFQHERRLRHVQHESQKGSFVPLHRHRHCHGMRPIGGGIASTSPSPLPTNTVIPATVAPTQVPASPTAIPPTIPPIATPTTAQMTFEGEEISVYPLTLHLSPELAGGMHGTQFPRLDGAD